MEVPTPPNEPVRCSHFATRFEQLANFVADPNAREMLAEGNINPLRGLVIRSILLTPGLPRAFYEHVHAPGYRRAGYNVLGIGGNAITVSDGRENVLKFYRYTSDIDEVAQKAAIDKWNTKQSLVLEHLGAYTISQTFSIEENPLDSSKSIVVARQKRIISSSAINVLNSETIPSLAQPFITASKNMHANSNPVAVPDLAGNNNVLVERHTDSIKLIDPIGLVDGDPGDEGAYLAVTNFLDTYR